MRQAVRIYMGFMVAAIMLLACVTHGHAEEAAGVKLFNLTIQNHTFQPATLSAPANQPLALHVVNKDNAAEEFESEALKREKIVPANGEITILLPALKPGTYGFVGEFHEETAKGTLVVQP